MGWRNSITREGFLLTKEKGIEADWEQFADDWRNGYAPAMQRVRNGELPCGTIDTLHRMIMNELICKYGLVYSNVSLKRHTSIEHSTDSIHDHMLWWGLNT